MSRGSWFPRNAPDTSLRPDDWRDHAACVDEDPELFFPIGSTGPAVLQIAEAKQVCRRCSVRAECRHFALSTNQEAGIWGGLSEDELKQERNAIKRRRAALNKAQQRGKQR